MNFITLICPGCSQRITVSENAPPRVFCPKCMGTVANPGAVTRIASAPRAVIPLEQQVESDRSFTGRASVVVTAMIVLGLVITLITPGLRGPTVLLLIMVVIAAAAAWAISGFPLSGNIKSASRQDQNLHASSPSARVELPGETLNYRSPPTFQYAQTEPTNYLAAVGGFFLALAVCAGGFVLLLTTVNGASANLHGNVIYLAIVALFVCLVAASGSILGRRDGWKGFRPGVYIGLTLGMLALGPCGFCYLFTL